MDEWIDIVNTDGKPTGDIILKSEAHQKGILHASVHIWFYTKSGQVLIQKRKSTKDVYPNYWDVSVAGHISAGEDILMAACREVKEEIGLEIFPKDLTPAQGIPDKKQHANGIIDYEYHHVFFCLLNTPLENLMIQKEEVEAIKLISLEELLTLHQQTKTFVPHPTTYINTVIKTIHKITKPQTKTNQTR